MPLSPQACNTSGDEGLYADRQVPSMSLILDALKKSEQTRQAGDAVWSTPSQRGLSRRTPFWAWALIVLLLINVLVLVAVVALRAPSPDTGSSSSVSAALDHPDPVAEASSSLSRPTVETAAASPIAASPIAAATAPSVSLSAPSFAALPSRDAVLARGAAIPAVNLTLHVFDPAPRARFILLDGERLGEGDTSKNGLNVNAITAEGVVFVFDGNTFKVSL